MLYRLRQRSTDESGFTLIELLVVILIIGILAAIAIPSLLSQKNKAYDAGAKELARSAQTTAETYATDHEGLYTGLTVPELHKYEITIPETKAAANGGAYMKEGGTGVVVVGPEEYSVTAVAAHTGDEYTILRKSNGEVTRTCKSTTGTKTGCAGSESSNW
ncbi:MAG TPA: prepilin-type N-terminal cleavage/methylation domain-containing protein [Solirubrobacteraceae bacterium]|jgi:prepilin-type N-terminal cleavage/methylation domain-containing protein|nr:prepilin-type N-terminal cleavage/methylation domain-containing protein [Solirubrobacteraceae bacterium]